MSSMIPPPLGLGRPSQKNKKYKLIMVQNPVRARCCGFGEKDRRPIDPPPILQLFIENPDGSLQNVTSDDDYSSKLSLFIVQCDLYSEDGKEQRIHVYNPSLLAASNYESSSTAEKRMSSTTGMLVSFQDPIPTRSLLGAITSNAYPLFDLNKEPGIFFIFQDLSVRIEGRFCLKFMFINLSAGDPLTMSTQVSDYVFSEPFTVYSAKNFPGMTDSTLLSQCFAQQGIKISIRKGRRVQRLVNKEDFISADQDTVINKNDTKEDQDKNKEATNNNDNFNCMHISTFLSSP
ncbi:velvet factor-domain-containing protein [Cokeromyces recurvatus]|uniref:velvet factor-domain-containing protein n=1 Tax=Cokeromyces recurvatus TaxID=90255 RepID=UPI00221E3975|nr:velvet factor-domain-containing protein [Cokeromyces recurvatus]KAI7904123.1 velvet factor-domain-containing protein [Cokeromyces recurvatus]